MLEFSSSKMVGKVTVVREVSEDEICNIIVNCFEGGSEYWLGLDNTGKAYQEKPKGEPLSTWCTKILLEGGTLKMYDIEEEDQRWNLTLKKLIKGIQMNAKERPEYSDPENWDANDTDCILQYALFGEVVFG